MDEEDIAYTASEVDANIGNGLSTGEDISDLYERTEVVTAITTTSGSGSGSALTLGSALASVSASGARDLARFERAQDDLNKFKKRIDANTEEQREHADMMAELQRKIEDYRRRVQDIEKQAATSTKPDVTLLSFNIKDVGDGWTSDLRTGLESGGGDLESAAAILDEERRRNNELRLQIARQQMEVDKIRQQFELNMRDKDKAYQQREQNMAHYLSEEQQRMMNLWTELQQVRQQFAEYREQTELELDNQRNEFARVSRNVGGMVRRLSISSLNVQEGGGGGGLGKDAELIEVFRRFQDQQHTSPKGLDSSDEYRTLMKKYEESIERIVELECRDDGSAAKISTLDAELKRTRQKLSEAQDALRKLHNMAKEADTKSGLTKRPRSLSPGSTTNHLAPSEVVATVRYVLRSADNEMQQLQRNLKSTQLQLEELRARFEASEEIRRRLEKQVGDSKKDLLASQKSLDEASREVKRLEDRLCISESENAFAEGVRLKLEDEIRRLKITLEEADVDGQKKALEEAESQKHLLEEDYNHRIAELTRRLEAAQEDGKKLRSDLLQSKDKCRLLDADLQIIVRKLAEKDLAIQNADEIRANMEKELQNQRQRFDLLTNEFESLQTNVHSTAKSNMAIELSIKEAKRQRDEISKEKEDLSKRLVDLSRRLAIEIKKREDIERNAQHNSIEMARLKEQLLDSEQQLQLAKGKINENEMEIQKFGAKIAKLENEIQSANQQIASISQLNSKLQADKQNMMSSQQKNDVVMDILKDKLRKYEEEVERIKMENGKLHEQDQQSQMALKQEGNKVHQLVLELKEARAEIDDLERKVQKLSHEDELRLQDVLSSEQVSKYEVTEITETKVKQIGDKHKMDLQKLEDQRDDLAGRLKALEDQMGQKDRTIEAQQTELADAKSRYEVELERLQQDLKALTTKHNNDMDDDRDRHNHELETLRTDADDLRNKIAQLETKLADNADLERTLRKEAEDWQDKHRTLEKDLHEAQDQLEAVRRDTDKEVQRWKTELYTAQMELKNSESGSETLRSQLAAANDRANSLGKTLADQSGKIRELNAQIRQLEEEIAEAKAKAESDEADLEDTKQRLKMADENADKILADLNRITAECDALRRKYDLLKATNTSNEAEIERLKKKASQMAELNKEQTGELDKLRNENDDLQRAIREKAKSVDQLQQTLQTLQTKVERQSQDLQTANDKLLVSESIKSKLTGDLQKMEQELQFAKEILARKTNEFQEALEELKIAHRQSEDGRIDAVQQLDSYRFQLDDLQSRLDNTDQRLLVLQQEYLKVDKDRETLNDALRRFQYVINRTMIPETAGEAPTDMQAIDVHLQKLVSRIEKLERERNQYRESLGRLQRKTSDSHVTINKQEHLYKTIEEKMVDIEEEKRSLELKLASAKELLRSQEEVLKQRDDERSAMKQKIITAELETRGKDAQIRHLNEQIKNTRNELENLQNENRQLKYHEEELNMNKVLLESKLRDRDGEAQKTASIVANFDTERQKLNESVKKLSADLLVSEARTADLKDDVERLKRDLGKAERTEVDLRRNLDEQTRLARECQHLKDRLIIAQNDVTNANSRKQVLDAELVNVRNDLRDSRQLLRETTNKLNDTERQLQNTINDKRRLDDRVANLEKMAASSRANESELRQKLQAIEQQVRAKQTELTELKQQTAQYEEYKAKVIKQLDEAKYTRASLMTKIELLENDRRIMETILSETAIQREAIECSLSALERENKELYRNCAQLQQQVQQLEADNGTRLVALANQQREEHQRWAQAVKAEKEQVERMVEHQQRVAKARLKQLELQVMTLREQLKGERARHREEIERTLRFQDVNGRIGNIIFGHGHGHGQFGGTQSAGAGQFGGTQSPGAATVAGGFRTPPPQPQSQPPQAAGDYRTMASSLATARAISPIDEGTYKESTPPLVTLEEPGTSTTQQAAAVVTEATNSLDEGKEAEEDVEIEKKTTTIVVHLKGKEKEHPDSE